MRLLLLQLLLFASSAALAQSPPPATLAAAPPPSAEGAASYLAGAEADKARAVRPTRFEVPPTIDGRLDEDCWRTAIRLGAFRQVQPGDNIQPSHPTEVMLGYSADHLYLAFVARDEPSGVRASVAKRDRIFDDDYVGAYLDTFDDRRKSYALFFNPLGVQADGVYIDGQNQLGVQAISDSPVGKEEDFSVDIVMESKGAVTADGYVVEVAIPFKSLRYKAGADAQWGMHLFRRIKRLNDELDSWMPISRDRSGILAQAGRLHGLEGIATERSLDLTPTLTVAETGKRARNLPSSPAGGGPGLNPNRLTNGPLTFDPGLTVKLGITPTVSLDLALNPDFAQVEADQAVVRVNERFPIFFEEKRPFFLEGIDVFQTPLNVVHTRTIIDPDYAAKLTGKSGRNTFGVLLASDNAPGNYSEEELSDPETFRRAERFVGKNAIIGVLRLKRDIGQDSSIGLIATSYDFVEKHGRLLGVDGRLRLNPQTIFNFQLVGTYARKFFDDPQSGVSAYRSGKALNYFWNYNRTSRNLYLNVRGHGRTRDYFAPLGFTQYFNTNFNNVVVRYTSDPKPHAKLVSWVVESRTGILYDWKGRLHIGELYPMAGFNFRRQSYLRLYPFWGRERLFEEEFGPQRSATRSGTFSGPDSARSAYFRGLEIAAGTTPGKKYSLSLDLIRQRGAFDLDLGAGPRFPRVSPAALADPRAGLDPGPGDKLFIDATVNYQPTNALRLSLGYIKSRLARQDTKRVAFDSNIFAFRSTYQFTRSLATRARLDYDTLASSVRGQFLLAWTPSPGTSMFVGYNDDLNYDGFNPFTGQRELGFVRNRREFFVKMSYLFRRSL